MITMILIGLAIIVIASVSYTVLSLRRVVPTNMVHIVQSGKTTTPYGRGKEAGNTYYQWPIWLPKFGVTVTEFPESIFQVSLIDYEAYDSARLPFVVDVTAFFRVDSAETAAQRVASFGELQNQLVSVLQGAVRRILATNHLEDIMQERSTFGKQFTDEVKAQIQEWGVLPVKTIEFMDLRDSEKGKVIANIMAKEQSRIERESRVTVAENHREAELKEIDAARTVEVQKQDAMQQVGLRTAEKNQVVGIADEKANQAIQEESRVTTEKKMAVKAVEAEKNAQIDKTVTITKAQAEKERMVISSEADKQSKILAADAQKETSIRLADGDLQVALKAAEGLRANGEAKAKAEELLLMAPVTAQITLAQEIGGNESYQQYLVTVEQINANKSIGIEMAKSIANADLKIISNGAQDGNILGGVAGLTSLFSPSGGTKIAGMLSAMSQTEEGKAVVDGLVNKLG